MSRIAPAAPAAVVSPAPVPRVTDDMSVREVLARWPATREVFERAGLMGCGGEQGPGEPLAFFARMHEVPIEPLKRALEDAIRAGRPRGRRELPVAPAAPLASEPAHRYVPFLLASVALTLTLGAALGMFNLARLTTPWFGGMTTGSVVAHAFAQVFGFVGLFVMGIACHVLPRFAGRPLGAPAIVRPMLILQAGGVLAIACAFLAVSDTIIWLWITGAAMLVAAGALFVLVVVRTVGSLRTPERFGRWVIAGAGWHVAAAAGSLVAAWRNDITIAQAFWPAALWGFAGSWIFGIGRRIFPGFLGWRPRLARAETAGFLIYQAAVALTVAGAWPAASGPAVLVAVGGAIGLLVAVPLHSWCLGAGTTPERRHDAETGHQQYVLAAWLWLHVALATGPLWTLVAVLRGTAVPPLVTDFARHALAFGFITQVMMGIATRILPVFTGHALWSPRARTAAFYLLNASVAMRALEAVVAAGFLPSAWPFIALAGPPAAAAVLLFGLNVTGTIFGPPAVIQKPERPPALADRRVGDILQIPGALDVLVDAGFTPLANPVMRATLAGSVTLRQACIMKDVAIDPLVARLDALQRPRTIALTPVR